MGIGIAYLQTEEINTVLCLQKMALAHDNEVPLPENMQPYVLTTLAWDNIDRLEETFTITGTSHRVNGIASKTSILAQSSLRHQELSKPRQSKEH